MQIGIGHGDSHCDRNRMGIPNGNWFFIIVELSKQEKATPLKIVGILLAFGGACFIVFYGSHIETGSAGFPEL